MKYKRNRALSFLLAFIMVFSMSVTGFADNISDTDTPEEVFIDEEIPYSEEVISNTDGSIQLIDEPILEDDSNEKENLNSVVKLEVSHVDAFSGDLISKDVYDLEIGKEVIPTDYILENIRDKFVESDTPQFVITENSSFTLYYENNEMIGDNPDNLSMEEIGKGEPISGGYAYPKIGLRSNANMFVKYNLNSNEWPNQGAINLSKVAEPVQGSTNLWEVTLKIEGKNLLTTSDIVLVLDKSGSMSGEKISNLKLAAKEFVDNLLLPDSVNRIALVTFDNGATVKSNFVDYTGKATLNSAIDNITASGGTNMQAGIHAAQALLDSSNATNKVMVLLGDGQPTYSYKVTDATGISLSNHQKNQTPYIIKDNPQIVAVDYSQVVGNGSSFNISYSDSYQVFCTEPNHNHGPFDSGFPSNHGIPTIFEANLAKTKGTQIYSIAFNADSNGQNVLNNSQNAGYYQINSTDLSPLNAVFSEISGKISYAAKDGIVTDPMGDMFDLASSESEIYVSQGNIQIQGNSIIWNTGNIAEGNPATLKYLVRIKAGADANILYPTNQETVFSYTDVYENNTNKNFPIPEVSIGGGRITLIGYEVNENGVPINSDGVIVDRPDLANIIYNRNYSNNPLSYNQTYTITPDNLDGYEYQKYLWDGNEGNETTLQILLLANKPTETVYFGYYKTKTVTVTFNENYPGSNVYTKNVNKGSSLGSEMPEDPQRIGYTFTGWNTEPNGTGSVLSSSTIVNQNITVYAQWQKNIAPSLEITGYTGVYDGLEHSITVGNLVEGDKV
ncbi:VWA domain-containing protein [Soehngenia saccharolytica]|nr:VWA domain-containing protein [Soehngenia saccharolytica]